MFLFYLYRINVKYLLILPFAYQLISHFNNFIFLLFNCQILFYFIYYYYYYNKKV